MFLPCGIKGFLMKAAGWCEAALSLQPKGKPTPNFPCAGTTGSEPFASAPSCPSPRRVAVPWATPCRAECLSLQAAVARAEDVHRQEVQALRDQPGQAPPIVV